ncbi:hypothetical protein BANRA_05085 [Escherichia coli]|nr:hypothetical protein BANRA_05085 [Escherichia coli]
MPFKPLVTAGIESLLNTFLYRSPALKTARSRLCWGIARGGKRLFDVIDSGVQRTPLMYWANGQAMLTAPLSPTPACCRNFAIASSLPH